MANVCENTLKVYSEDNKNIEFIVEFINKEIPYADIENIDNSELEVYFDSKWTFPKDIMNELFKGIPNKDDIEMTCLSVEWGCYYCEFNFCDSNGWKQKE